MLQIRFFDAHLIQKLIQMAALAPSFDRHVLINFFATLLLSKNMRLLSTNVTEMHK